MTIPYRVPVWRNANSCISDSALNACITKAEDVYRNNFHYTGDLSLLVFTVDGFSNNIYRVDIIPNPYINVSIVDDFDFTNSSINVRSGNNLPIIEIAYNPNNGGLSVFNYSNTAVANLCGNSATTEQTTGYLTPRYPFYMVGVDEIKATNDVVVFSNIVPVSVPTGHATQPINNPENIINGLDGHKLQKPTAPTINNYSWTTYNNPPIDTSTVETLLESIFNSMIYNFSYLFTNLGGLFSNLINNIGNLIEYVVNSIYYAVNNIVSSIQDLATDFYNNMVSLFEPIAENIKTIREKIEEFADLFIHPFDSEEFDEQIANSSFFTQYNQLIDNCEVLTEIIDYAEERDHFSLYISFENPIDNSNHRIIQSEINFDWLVPLRSIYRPFLWVCVLIELFVGGARVLTHALGGHGV